MKRLDYLYSLKSPLPNAVLKKWPDGNVRQFWGENPQLYSKGMGDLHSHLGGHTGIDIATFHRDPVYAAHDGYVPAHMVFNDRTRAGGREVWVYSPLLDGETALNSQVCTVYCHLDEIAVTPGQQVKQGDLIGYEGNTGFVVSGGTEYWGNAPAGRGVHLHFGLYELMFTTAGWQQRYDKSLPLKGSSDPLPYITETLQNPAGNVSGMAGVLSNMAAYLAKWRPWN
jgi:murein DD-endopeptidase MepM/ murein hydrolase activator NlpD